MSVLVSWISWLIVISIDGFSGLSDELEPVPPAGCYQRVYGHPCQELPPDSVRPLSRSHRWAKTSQVHQDLLWKAQCQGSLHRRRRVIQIIAVHSYYVIFHWQLNRQKEQIYMIKFDGLFFSGVHAREWASPAAVTFIIRELVENRSRLPADIQALDFYILPVFNPDGYEFTHTRDRMWRKNRSQFARNVCVGADVNRNFDFMFGGQGTSGSPCSDIFRGRAASSELETQALSRFLQSLRGSLKVGIPIIDNKLWPIFCFLLVGFFLTRILVAGLYLIPQLWSIHSHPVRLWERRLPRRFCWNESGRRGRRKSHPKFRRRDIHRRPHC